MSMTFLTIRRALRPAAHKSSVVAGETGATFIRTMQALILITLTVTLTFVLIRSLYLLPNLKKDMAARCAVVLEKEKAYKTAKETFLTFGADNAASMSELGVAGGNGLTVRAETPADNQIAVYVYPDRERFSPFYPPLIYTCGYTITDAKTTQSRGFQGADGTVSGQ
jgi:hypothetical protein